MQPMRMICSLMKRYITPVDIWMQILTTTVIIRMAKAIIFVKISESLWSPREGQKKPMETHIIVVPVSLAS
ncbi:hypothetical protein ACHQM5_017555 [Ranunculus cassubicifolius]